MSKSEIREYRIWKAMKSRCNAPCLAHLSYQNKGIKVCDKWAGDFDAFIQDMGVSPSDEHSIERIDNNGDYCPSNCKWATKSEQSKNRGSFNKVFTYEGESLVLKDWARKFGIKYTTLYQRIYRGGMSFEDAINQDPFSRMFTINGESRTSTEWCKIIGVKPQIVVDRVRRGSNQLEELTKLINDYYGV